MPNISPALRLRSSLTGNDAVALAGTALAQTGFIPSDWNFDEAWAGVDGWQGIILQEGSSSKTFAANLAVEAAPILGVALLAAFPSMRRQHGLLRVAVVARPDLAGGCEVLCALVDKEGASSLAFADEFAASAFDTVTAAFASRNALTANPEGVRTLRLPKGHPLHPQTLIPLKKQMRKQKKKQ
ncbi:hypothetical protein [Schaalia vaccimaxillae]|uniref:hypothetical protein n=1 Tax=Schaalia vaccimaxillae TaxID=183916 RepID=UPI0003B39386|nr:hypothetical protein [Schaalia vaccimaxillae]